MATETWAAAVVVAATVAATKTRAATAMTGAQKTINNQLKAVVVTAMKMAMVTATTMTTMMTMAIATAMVVGSGGNGKVGSPPWRPEKVRQCGRTTNVLGGKGTKALL